MWGSTILDVGIGLAFLYLLLALVCSVLQEFIANVTSWRGRHLLASIKSMLNDPNMSGLAKRVYENPRIKSLSFRGKLPSYIPSLAFSNAIIDTLIESGDLASIPQILEGPIALFQREAAGDVEKLRTALQTWFDDAMDRFGGWYKRNVQLVIFAMGFAVAVMLNTSTIDVSRQLWEQPAIREAIVAQAAAYRSGGNTAPPPGGAKVDLNNVLNQLDQQIPIGWSSQQAKSLLGSLSNAGNQASKGERLKMWGSSIVGWALTAFAISLGAQFWFDTLGKGLGLRAAGEKPR